MEYYTQSYDDIKAWNDYELVKEVQKSFDFYIKNKDTIDLESINTPSLIKKDTIKKN